MSFRQMISLTQYNWSIKNRHGLDLTIWQMRWETIHVIVYDQYRNQQHVKIPMSHVHLDED